MCSDKGNRSLKSMLRLMIMSFQLCTFCGRQDRDFGELSRRASIGDESPALPNALDSTKEDGISDNTAITLCQDISDISSRPSGRSWKETRKAEGGFHDVPKSLQRPGGRPFRTLQKGHYVFGFRPNVGSRTAPHPVVFAIFPGCQTPANGHRFVGWRREFTKG